MANSALGLNKIEPENKIHTLTLGQRFSNCGTHTPRGIIRHYISHWKLLSVGVILILN
jgi:hypothetical protein